MLQISRAQMSAIRNAGLGELSGRLRRRVADITEWRRLAAEDGHWNSWWKQILETSTGLGARSPKALAAHATFSLWFGQRYHEDPRVPWLRELLANDQGEVDYRRCQVDVDRVVEIAALSMATLGGNAYQRALERLELMATRCVDGDIPEWSATGAERAMATLYPERFEDLALEARRWIVGWVELVSEHFEHGQAVRLPYLISVFLFGVDPWRDLALPELNRSTAQVLAASPTELFRCLRRQARFSRSAPPLQS